MPSRPELIAAFETVADEHESLSMAYGGGDPDTVARAKKRLGDAIVTRDELLDAIYGALAATVEAVPQTATRRDDSATPLSVVTTDDESVQWRLRSTEGVVRPDLSCIEYNRPGLDGDKWYIASSVAVNRERIEAWARLLGIVRESTLLRSEVTDEDVKWLREFADVHGTSHVPDDRAASEAQRIREIADRLSTLRAPEVTDLTALLKQEREIEAAIRHIAGGHVEGDWKDDAINQLLETIAEYGGASRAVRPPTGRGAKE